MQNSGKKKKKKCTQLLGSKTDKPENICYHFAYSKSSGWFEQVHTKENTHTYISICILFYKIPAWDN